VPIHGKATCPCCGAEIQIACEGAGAGEAIVRGDGDFVVPTDLFARLFARLGGLDASVTEDALLFALTELQDVDLDGARLLLEAGVHTRAIRRAGPHYFRLRRRRRS
jgi:hypothetical protein